MVEIECHICGKNFNLAQCINTDNYEGEVACPECESILHVKLVKGKLQKRKLVSRKKKEIKFTADELALMEIPEQEEQKLIEQDAPKLPVSMDDKPPKASSQRG